MPRKKATSGEPEHFQKVPPPPPDPSNPERQEWIKRGQRILHGALWLSTRTRPDLAYAVSATAQVLTKDLELLDQAATSATVPEHRQDQGTVLPASKEKGTCRVYRLWRLVTCARRKTFPMWVYCSPILWKCQTLDTLAISERTQDS